MSIGKRKTILTIGLMSTAMIASAQASSAGPNYLVYSLIGVAIILFFYLVIQVSDNLMVIEAKQMGADKSGANFSLFPRLKEIFAARLPDYVNGDRVVRLDKGLDLLLEGVPESIIDDRVMARTFAMQPTNFRGIAPIPKLMVEIGDEVKAGDPLFYDKSMPDVMFVAPVSGEVIAVNRGAKRSITEVVILADKKTKYRKFDVPTLESASAEDLQAFLQQSGMWPLIRQRPYDLIPTPGEQPRDIFITTFDTAPLAPKLDLIVAGKEAHFQRGLDVLNRLTAGKVYLGLNGRGEEPPAQAFIDAVGVEKYWIHGKHPAGNVGVQMHHIAPLSLGDKVWTMGVQEVIMLGELFNTGLYNAERIVALTGAELEQPKYVRTYMGANIGDLLQGNVKNDNVRMISGDVLSGQKKKTEQFLNALDDQITVIEEGDYFELFGWLLPIAPRPSISRTFPNFLWPDYRYKPDTNTHGEKRAFVVTGQYEEVLPMDIYPQHLMKAILTNDFERMEGLGIFELSEEDIAPCEFVCTSKQPLQHILRKGHYMMLEQG